MSERLWRHTCEKCLHGCCTDVMRLFCFVDKSLKYLNSMFSQKPLRELQLIYFSKKEKLRPALI